MKNRYYYVILLFITLCGLFIRMHGLSTLGLGFDEPQHIYAAESILKDGTPTLPSGLYYSRSSPFTYMVAGSFKLFGVNELAARLPSVVFGLLSIVLVFFIGCRFFEKTTGLVAAFLMAFIPFEVVWTRACRMYSMYQFFFLAGFFTLYLGLEANKPAAEPSKQYGSNERFITSSWNLNWTWLALSGVSLLIAFYLQPLVMSFGVSFIFYLLCMAAITVIKRGASAYFKSKYFYFLMFGTGSAIVLLFPLHFLEEVITMAKYSPPWSEYMGVSPTYYIQFLIGPVLYPIMVFFILGTVQIVTRTSRAGFFTLTTVLIPLSFHSLLTGVQSSRYIYDIFPLLLLISAYAISNFWENELLNHYFKPNENRGKSRGIECIRWMLMVFLALTFCIPFFYGVLGAARISLNRAPALGGEYHAQWREACKFVNDRYKLGEIIIAGTPLAADFCGCKKAAYILNNGEIDMFREVKGADLALDVYSNAKAITSLKELRTVLSKNPTGWLVIDAQRFQNPATVPADVKDFITKHLVAHATPADRTMYVFSWGSNEGIE